MKITDYHFNNIVKSESNREISRRYDAYNNVESIDIEEDSNGYKINAIVNVLGKKTECFLWMNKQEEITKWECNCIWCEEDNACGHIGAVILKLMTLSIDHIPYHYRSDKELKIKKVNEEMQRTRRKNENMRLLKQSYRILALSKMNYRNNLEDLLNNDTYELEATMVYDQEREEYFLTYRVGNEKKYILRSVDSLLSNIDNKEMVRYGKLLSFRHTLHAFTEDAQKQIQFMRYVLQKEEDKEEHYYYGYYRNNTIGKQLYIKRDNIDEFFSTYNTLQDDTNMTFEISEDPIQLHMLFEDDIYRISLKDKDYLLGENNAYKIISDRKSYKIIQYTLDDNGKTVKLLESLTVNDFACEKDYYSEFYKYVLSDILDYISIETDDQTLIEEIDTYDNIRLYGDIDDEDQVCIELKYFNESGDFIPGFNDDNITTFKQDIVETYIIKYASVVDKTNHIAYLNVNDESTYTFVSEGIEYLKQYCDIYVSEQLLNLGKKNTYSIQVGVRIENNLLEIDINSVEIPKDELAYVLSSYRRKKKFHRLKNGNLIYLNSPQLEELDELLEDYHISEKDINNGSITMDAYRMFSVDQKAEEVKYIQVERSKSFQQQIQNFKSIDANAYQIPKPYDAILRDYQKEGYRWLNIISDYGFNGILADDMGLGKTLQVIAMLDGKEEKGTSIVICPSSLIYNWEDEVHKFSKSLNIIPVCGNAEIRKGIIMGWKKYDVLVTSYDYLRRDVELYETIDFDYVILDEAQYIKNQKTKNAISVKKLKAKHRLALTGTPIENSLAELWSIFDFLMPNYLFNYHYFLSHYETDIVKNHDEKKQIELKKLVTPFILRRNKKEVLKELPDKIEKTQIIEFNEEENKLYLANLAQCNRELQELTHMQTNGKIQILAMLTRLRQLCCEPRLLYENIYNPSTKLKFCVDLIETIHENGQKTLLFSSFTSVLDLIAEELYSRGISFYMLTGKTDKEERRGLVDKFQKDKTAVFLISLKAGGTGLNLTAAQSVIHYDPWWNLSAQNQATDRAYRIGQNENVQVYKLVMKNSIEEKIQKLQNLKKDLADTFVENNDGSITNMSQDELMELFKM